MPISEGEEGKYYLWDFDEIRTTLSAQKFSFDIVDPIDFFISAYDIKQTGNFEGKTILQRSMKDEELMARYNLSAEQVASVLREMHNGLRAVRDRRQRPSTDDKVLVAWNALGLAAFAEAARYLHRDDYLAVARKNAAFLLDNLYSGDRLFRSWRKGTARHNAYLEDYAALCLGLLALYQSDPDVRWFRVAFRLTSEIVEHFSDPDGGFFDTRDDHDALLLRPKDLQDNAIPCGNSIVALALLEMAIYTGETKLRNLAEVMLGKIQSAAIQYPTAFAMWLNALDFSTQAVREVALLGDQTDPLMQTMVDAVWGQYRPNILVAISGYPPASQAPLLIQNRPLLNDLPTAYVCQGFVCKNPVNSSQEMLSMIDQPIT